MELQLPVPAMVSVMSETTNKRNSRGVVSFSTRFQKLGKAPNKKTLSIALAWERLLISKREGALGEFIHAATCPKSAARQ